jgi:Uncharacterized conserved protein
MFQESCYSKAIDYPNFDIMSVITKQSLEDNGILNILTAYKYALETSISKLNYDDVFRRILNEDISKKKVYTRSKQIFLSKTAPNYRKYNPTAPENISPALHDIHKYIVSSEIDTVIKAAMCHYQFEMIHPYEYYNGLVGRILIYKILSNAGIKGASLQRIFEVYLGLFFAMSICVLWALMYQFPSADFFHSCSVKVLALNTAAVSLYVCPALIYSSALSRYFFS